MKVKYDTTIDAKYVLIKRGKVHTTKPLNDWLIFDYNKDGDIVGVEILNASKNHVALITDADKLVSIEILRDSICSGGEPAKKYAKEVTLGSDLSSVLQYA